MTTVSIKMINGDRFDYTGSDVDYLLDKIRSNSMVYMQISQDEEVYLMPQNIASVYVKEMDW